MLLGILAQIYKILKVLCPFEPRAAILESVSVITTKKSTEHSTSYAPPAKEDEMVIGGVVEMLKRLDGQVEFDFGEQIAPEGSRTVANGVGETSDDVGTVIERVSLYNAGEFTSTKKRSKKRMTFEDETGAATRDSEQEAAMEDTERVKSKRRLMIDEDIGVVYMTTSSDEETQPQKKEKSKKKIKKKRGDAIDDLFSGLV